jgi:hypothetical protein
MKTPPHPPYSPDIAPSDFSIFGYVKGRLTGRSFVDAEELFEAVRGVLNIIEKVTFQAMFLEWIGWLRRCIQANGEYTA